MEWRLWLGTDMKVVLMTQRYVFNGKTKKPIRSIPKVWQILKRFPWNTSMSIIPIPEKNSKITYLKFLIAASNLPIKIH